MANPSKMCVSGRLLPASALSDSCVVDEVLLKVVKEAYQRVLKLKAITFPESFNQGVFEIRVTWKDNV